MPFQMRQDGGPGHGGSACGSVDDISPASPFAHLIWHCLQGRHRLEPMPGFSPDTLPVHGRVLRTQGYRSV